MRKIHPFYTRYVRIGGSFKIPKMHSRLKWQLYWTRIEKAKTVRAIKRASKH